MDNSILGWIWALFYRVFSLIYCCEVVYKDGPRPRLIRRTPSSRCCMAKVVDLWGPKIATVPTHSLKIHAGSAPGPARISRMGRAYFTLMKNQWIWACCWSIAAQWEQTRGHLDPTGIQDAFTVAKATLPRVALIENPTCDLNSLLNSHLGVAGPYWGYAAGITVETPPAHFGSDKAVFLMFQVL